VRGLNFTLRRIFHRIRNHRGFALALWPWEANQKAIRAKLDRERKVLALAYVMTARILTN
jgi:hypothetical protein